MAVMCFLSTFVAYIALLFFFSYHIHHVSADNLTDLSSLLAFKSAISSDPHGFLTQWNDTIHFCDWAGITCDAPRERVVSLQLSSLDFAGVITAELSNLTSLVTINLTSNHLHGPIPRELSRLPRLQTLNLGFNSLVGTIPSEFGSLSSLYNLDVSNNSITGEIPPSLANASSLRKLDLWCNQLSGHIPPSLSTLSNLTRLDLGINNLGGPIPASLWNMSSLRYLSLDANRLFGSLPQDIGHTLPDLQFLSVPYNELRGEIPSSLPDMSRLYAVQLQGNNFTGTIPPNIGNLRLLRWLDIGYNQLEAREREDWSFLDSLSNCTLLEELTLPYNNLGGLLPKSITNLSSTLQFINLGNNYIHGSIPADIGNLVNLTYFDLGPNFLSGSLPDSIGLLQNLHIIDLNTNNLSGEIPPGIGNLSFLNLIFLDDNMFHGSIPSSIGNCKSLEMLYFGHNMLTGTIPRELLSIPTISRGLSLEGNLLTGSIPSEVGSLSNLGILDLSGNKLSGEIPSSIGECQVLETLRLDRNFFRGNIPTSMGTLKGLQELNLSQNNLSGQLPRFLVDLPSLYYLGLSLNNFQGEVPVTGVFANLSAVSVQGNNKLCGGKPMLHLPPCNFLVYKKKHTTLLAVTISVTSVFLFLILLIFFCYLRRQRLIRRKPIAEDTTMEQIVRISYAELVTATDGFSEANVIGSGSFGTVYKGILPDEHSRKIVAVKVFDLQQLGASKSFVAECEALRNIRHRNLIKIITACSSTDFRGNDFKAMVFEFMENGSLDSWLHSEPRKLNLIQRLNIAVDVASALSYLHSQGEIPIVHCDLKPSNILLDDDMTAIVTDFGLARFIEKTSQSSTSSLGMRGTIGYIAPEYGMANKVSTHGDVYSYGILLLELFTGKRPTDNTFKEGLSLRAFVKMALPEKVVDIMDVCMLTEGDKIKCGNATYINCVSSVLTIGLLCTKELTLERM